MTAVSGSRDLLIGKLQTRYGLTKDQAEQQVDNWVATLAVQATKPLAEAAEYMSGPTNDAASALTEATSRSARTRTGWSDSAIRELSSSFLVFEMTCSVGQTHHQLPLIGNTLLVADDDGSVAEKIASRLVALGAVVTTPQQLKTLLGISIISRRFFNLRLPLPAVHGLAGRLGEVTNKHDRSIEFGRHTLEGLKCLRNVAPLVCIRPTIKVVVHRIKHDQAGCSIAHLVNHPIDVVE